MNVAFVSHSFEQSYLVVPETGSESLLSNPSIEKTMLEPSVFELLSADLDTSLYYIIDKRVTKLGVELGNGVNKLKAKIGVNSSKALIQRDA